MAELKKAHEGRTVLRPSLVMVSLGSDSQEEPEAGDRHDSETQNKTYDFLEEP
jgi:hypothetical protein